MILKYLFGETHHTFFGFFLHVSLSMLLTLQWARAFCAPLEEIVQVSRSAAEYLSTITVD